MSSILITGATGSFGRAFARHCVDTGVERICLYSRGEHAQAAMRQEFNDHESLRWLIGDVRDRDRLRRAMEGCDTVVHAAALKRIEVCEYCPLEAVKTNVIGAMNVIEAAQDAGVRRVIALSTDKACNPTNAYGSSKLLAEKMFLAANNMTGQNPPFFAVTRYGNIAGSQGSVIPKWREISTRDRGPRPRLAVPITNPNATRFWMTIDQAVELVWNTARTMQGGELVIPELPAYRLGDLAEAMNVETYEIGLPKYEKLHECMADDNCSNKARRMSVNELREALRYV